MEQPGVDLASLKTPKAWEYAVRFVFGALVTVATGLITKRFGFAVGGMFLAFPAILPASLTLVKRHDGRRQAGDDARGARIGTLGLFAFFVVVALTAGALPAALTLAAALLAWTIVAVTAWFVVRKAVAR
jgi:uncharacterized membrane protein (GlpM family)